jgi:hypothetical protein
MMNRMNELVSYGIPTMRAASRSEWQRLQWQQVRDWLSPILQSSPIEIAIVGDVSSLDDTINNITTYWATIPTRSPLPININISDPHALVAVPPMITGTYHHVVNRCSCLLVSNPIYV